MRSVIKLENFAALLFVDWPTFNAPSKTFTDIKSLQFMLSIKFFLPFSG